DNVGMPLREGLLFVANALVGAGLRDRVRIGASGKVTTGFDIARALAVGADWCNAARGFMFAVGCIQAQACHTGKCPTGVTSMDPLRYRGIKVVDKAERVANFHRETLRSLSEMVAAAGLDDPSELKPEHFRRRTSPDDLVTFATHYRALQPGELLDGTDHPEFATPWAMARADTFKRAEPFRKLVS
ncbi:MAG: glutamate synthase-related protein, partial [Pseudomonadota bacterium]